MTPPSRPIEARRALRRRFLWLVAGAASLWLLVMLVAGDSGALALWRARAKLLGLEAKAGELEAENRRLAASVHLLAHDDHAVECIAREELMMARPDEETILVPALPVAAGGRDQSKHP